MFRIDIFFGRIVDRRLAKRPTEFGEGASLTFEHRLS